MAPTQSDEAIQGSAGAGSNQASVEPTRYASNRVACSTQGSNAPVNVTLALLPFSHSSVPPPRDHTELLSSVDNLFGGQHHGSGSVAAPSATAISTPTYNGPANGRPSVEIALRSVGSHFDEVRSTSAGSSGEEKHQ